MLVGIPMLRTFHTKNTKGEKMKTYHIRVREERVGYYTVKAESLNEAEKKAHYNLRGEIGGEIIPSVDFVLIQKNSSNANG